MRHILLITCLSPLMLVTIDAASAQTTVASATTTPLATSTAGDVTVSSAGSITPAAAGTAVTIDSANSVSDAGSLTYLGIDNATGIAANAGTAGTITNSGTISVGETVTTQTTGGTDLPFATGTNRFGIHALGGFTGSIVNTGTITIVGNASSGIATDGTLNGSVSSSGTIDATGTNAYGVHTQAVTGNVTLSGTIATVGQGASSIALDGDVGGAVEIAGAVTNTGYRYTASTLTTLDSQDLLIGGPAVRIAGNVAGGVSVAVDTTLGTGVITNYGSAPALLIGSTSSPITLGLVSGATSGLVVAGSVLGYGVYSGIGATALQIGGTGGTVAITGGITNSGTIEAISGDGSTTSTTSTAILIGSGATVPSITNSGTIFATSVGTTGTAVAIQDLTGTLTSITNTATISATLASGYVSTEAIAIDLSANTSGVTITQTGTAATITGQILTGSGNDSLNILGGAVTGNANLGAGDNSLTLNAATMVGSASFGDGDNSVSLVAGTLTGGLTFGSGSNSITMSGLSTYTGLITQGTGLIALDVEGGAFNPTNTGTIALSSLKIGATGSLLVNLDTATGIGTNYTVTGAATIASGAKLTLNLSNFLGTEQVYRLITAGSLTGSANLSLTGTSLPYLFAATLTPSDTTGTVDLDLRRKTASELGLNRSGASAYNAIYTAIQTDTSVEGVFLGVSDATTFKRLYSAFLPDHNGGPFLSAVAASRGVADMETSAATPRVTSGKLGLWIGEVANYLSRPADAASGYKATSWTIAGGAEYRLPVGTIGLSFASAYNLVDDSQNSNQVTADQIQLGGYWRADWGGLHAKATGAYSFMDFRSTRSFDGSDAGSDVARTAAGKWSGKMVALSGGASYQQPIGRLYLRPGATVDYFKLTQDGYAETGGGTAFDLTVAKRSSDELAAEFTLAAGIKLGGKDGSMGLRLEVEGGDRQILRGSIGTTTASFSGGQSFTLTPDDLTAGPTAKIRLSGGNEFVSVSGEVGAERIQGQASLGAHIALKLAL